MRCAPWRALARAFAEELEAEFSHDFLSGETIETIRAGGRPGRDPLGGDAHDAPVAAPGVMAVVDRVITAKGQIFERGRS